ncbi:MAG: diguanylate cyclase, partial [Gammaproteobacteria bacterium]|nr:diguanylate cyclase [Gammaproteobacteria bacterium]
FAFPSFRIEYELTWQLAEAACQEIAPYLESPLTTEDLQIFHSAPFAALEEADLEAFPSEQGQQLHLPMVVHGELAGCLSLLLYPGAAVTEEQQLMLGLLSNQLASSICNIETQSNAEDASSVDELTGLRNIRYLKEVLPAEWRRARRYDQPLTLAILDIDRFHEVNERYGHIVGDHILVGFGAMMSEHLRDTDHLVRFAGKKFLLILPETGPSEAAIVVERIRYGLKREPVYSSDKLGPIQVSCSAGLASYPICLVNTPEDLVDTAAQALKSAKLGGTDQVCMAAGKSIQSLSELQIEQGQGEKRRFPRIATELKVRYVELPDFEGQMADATTINVNPGGISVEDPDRRLRKHLYTLVYVEDAQAPVLSRVVWTKDDESGKRSAGLQFLRAGDFDGQVRKTKRVKILPRALVVTDNPRTWNMVQRGLIAARYRMQVIKRAEDMPDSAELSKFELIVVGESSLRGWLGIRLQLSREGHSWPGRIVVINEVQDRKEALTTICDHEVEYFVSIDNSSDEALFATLNKLLLGEYFGMQKYLLWGVNPTSWTIRRSEDKEIVLDGIRQIAHEVYCHPRIADLLIAAVDEMLINAMRIKETREELLAKKSVTVECGTDGRLLAVAVLDEHGLFQKSSLYHGLGTALTRESQGIPKDADSASLGFRVMLNCLSQLAINVEPGRCTEIIGIVDLRKSVREYRCSVPSMGVFIKHDDAEPDDQSPK